MDKKGLLVVYKVSDILQLKSKIGAQGRGFVSSGEYSFIRSGKYIS